jgi:hypothetical protein
MTIARVASGRVSVGDCMRFSHSLAAPVHRDGG